MSSLRKRYAPAVSAERPDSPPVAATPVAAAEPPRAAEAPKPLEELAPEKSPSDEAANNAIKARLAEMNRAETLQRAPPVQHYERVESRPPELSDPVEAAIAAMPPRVRRWYRTNPELLTNPEFAARVQYCHHVAAREVGQQFTDPYFDRMESLLGFRQQQQPKPSNNGHAAPAAQRPASAAPAAPARNAAPARQQQYNGGSASAPTSREAPSMSTGKPMGRRVPLTEDEIQIARNSGISPEEYSIQKEKMARLRAAGAVQ
jgi:hypothetical protein